MKENLIYLDNASTTPLDPEVKDAMLAWLGEKFGNPSSVHSYGREAKVMIEDTRDLIADFLGVRSSELYFTSGGTESNNFALIGLAMSHLHKKNKIISSPTEHSSVLETLKFLRDKLGFDVLYSRVARSGEFELDKNLLDENVFLICAMHVNNELGTVNDIVKLRGEIPDNVFIHSDCVQSLGKLKSDLVNLGCSTASFSAHKIYGPKGIGALYIKKGTPVEVFMHGGSQERARRGGTENVAAIAGFGKAVEILKKKMDSDIHLYRELNSRLKQLLFQNFRDDVIINSPENNSVFNIINISLNSGRFKIDPETFIIQLEMKGIAVSSGSACTSGTLKPSHVLKALGYDDDSARTSLRISFGRFNKAEDVDMFIKSLKEILSV